MSAPSPAPALASLRKDFPILATTQSGKPLVYLDSAATSQKPRAVIDALRRFYEQDNANIHRSAHGLANRATELYERTRSHVGRFIGATCAREIVFTRNTTESINLVAQAWGRANLKAGDKVVLTEMEHHANLVPWQMLKEQLGIELAYIPFDAEGQLELPGLDAALKGAKLFAFGWASNVLGTINPAKQLAARAKAAGALVLVDAAQAAPHFALNVKDLGADFVAFSGHKMLGPTGVGVLWGRLELLEAMPAWQGGGSMIERVSLTGYTYNQAPWKFEAGTPDIASVAAFDEALGYLEAVGLSQVQDHERGLMQRTMASLKAAGAQVYGPAGAEGRVGLVSFNLPGINCLDVAQVLDSLGIACRSGALCTHLIMDRCQVAGMLRVSYYLYNDESDVAALEAGLARVARMFKKGAA
jgi:cysteine desulfurase/selenocysteine lyase